MRLNNIQIMGLPNREISKKMRFHHDTRILPRRNNSRYLLSVYLGVRRHYIQISVGDTS